MFDFGKYIVAASHKGVHFIDKELEEIMNTIKIEDSFQDVLLINE